MKKKAKMSDLTMNYLLRHIRITDNNENRIDIGAMIQVLEKENYFDFDLDELIKTLRIRGWKGMKREKGIKMYKTAHLTKVQSLKFPSPVKHYINEDDDENFDNCAYIPLYSKDYAFKKSNEEKLSDDFTLVFYDVEVMPTGVFCGLLIDGYEYVAVPIYEMKQLMFRIARTSKKRTVFIAYNDSYDGNMINGINNRFDTKDALEYSNNFFKAVKAFNTLKEEKKVTYDDNPLVYKRNALPIQIEKFIQLNQKKSGVRFSPSYNPLAKECSIYTFDMFKEMFNKIGSLKHHCAVNGIEWSHSLHGDIFEYNKEDVENMKLLFVKNNGMKLLKTMFFLLDQVKYTEQVALSLTLINHIFASQILGSDLVEDKECWCLTNIYSYCEKLLENHDIKEKDGFVIYSENQKVKLRGGYGGIHSETQPMVAEKGFDNYIFDIDFSSFYPNIFLSDNCPIFSDEVKLKIKDLLALRMELKKRNDPSADSLKIFLNSIYGRLNLVTAGGRYGLTRVVTAHAKVYLCDLLRKLEPITRYIIDVNTDGVICSINKSDLNELNRIIEESPLPLEKKEIKKIYYRCSGQYAVLFADDEVKIKGAWLSGSNYSSSINQKRYIYINLNQLFSCFLRGEDLPDIKISEKSDEGLKIITQLPFRLSDKGKYSSCSIKEDQVDTENTVPQTPEELKKFILKMKLRECEDYNDGLTEKKI